MMHVQALWRHPVKSLRGESLDAAQITEDGLRGDRRWGVRDEATGMVLTGRREPRLLGASAALDADGAVEICLPDGTTMTGGGPATDAALTNWLGHDVTLLHAADSPAGHAEFFADATDDSSEAVEWTMPVGRFVDAMPILLLTTASLRAGAALYPDGNWDVRRFRPNILVHTDEEGWVEDEWCDRIVRIGEVELLPRQPCVRCTMVTRPQPDLERDLDIYKTLARHHEGTFGVWATVQTPGVIQVGDKVEVA
jgi:uncharacterized protein YcbX